MTITESSLNKRLHVLTSSVIATFVYVAICLVAFQYLDENNSVVDGSLLPNSDHWPLARQLMAERTVSNFRYPPGFALYIASASIAADWWGQSYFFWRLVQDSVSTAATSVIIMLLMLRLTNLVWTGWGGVLLLIYNLTYSAGTASDLAMASFMPWFFGGLLLFVKGLQEDKKVWMGVAGALFALSGFVRPDVLLFVPFLGVSLLLLERSQGRSTTKFYPVKLDWATGLATAMVGFALTVLPWVGYSTSRSGSLVVYSTGFVPSHIDGMAQFSGNPVSEFFVEQHPMVTWGQREKMLNSTSDLARMHLLLFQTYPRDWIRLWAEKLWHPWYASHSKRWNWILATQTLLILIPVFAGVYLWILIRGPDLAFAVAIAVIAYFWLVTLLVLSINRYMPPVYPFLGMFAGFAAQILLSRRASHSNTPDAQPV